MYTVSLREGETTIIQSPGFPTYPNNADVTWTLSSPSGFFLRFYAFALDTGSTYDYLSGGEGDDPDNSQVFRLTGSAFDEDGYTFTGNAMWLHFHSYSSYNSGGFIAEITAVSTSLSCKYRSTSCDHFSVHNTINSQNPYKYHLSVYPYIYIINVQSV